MNDIFNELSRCNYWSGQMQEAGTPRKTYLNPIIGYIGNKLIKILTGQRGTGKATLLRQIAAHLLAEGVSPRNILYISRSFTDTGIMTLHPNLSDLLTLYHEKIHPVGKIYLFIEEVQNLADWQQFVHTHSQDSTITYEIFLSASGKDQLTTTRQSPLARSCVYFEVQPLSYAEYLAHTKDEPGPASYRAYSDTPHLPGLYMQPPHQAAQALIALKNTILLRDIICQYRIKDPILLEQLLLHLIKNLSQPLSINQLVSHFTATLQRTSYETIANYISYLEETYLIHRVERYQIKGREIISGSCRYYLNTYALATLVYPLCAPDAEVRLKNQVYHILRRAGYTIYTGIQRNRTIDFVAQHKDRIIYLQCTTTLSNISHSETLYTTLAAINDNYEKWVISLDAEAAPSREGIRNIQAWGLAELL